MGSLLGTLTVTLWSNKLWLTSLHSILCWAILPGHRMDCVRSTELSVAMLPQALSLGSAKSILGCNLQGAHLSASTGTWAPRRRRVSQSAQSRKTQSTNN